jgi:hypothetical protein
MKALKFLLILLCVLSPLLTSCTKKKKIVEKVDKTTILYEQMMAELTDSLCNEIVATSINNEIKQKIDFSECVIRLKKYPDVVYSNNSRVVGEGFFEGKVKNKRGTFFYEITLQCSNRRLKDKTAWEVRKLVIHVAGDTKPFFISGKEAPK